MSAETNTFETPKNDAPAQEWGALAVSIPGWRWPDGMHDAAPGFVQSRYGIGSTGDVIPYAAEVAQTPVVVCYPDPDHWAWEGWLLRLLGRGIYHIRTASEDADGQTVWQFFCSGPDDAGEQWSAERLPLGRAAIAAAAALGRWPGGAS